MCRLWIASKIWHNGKHREICSKKNEHFIRQLPAPFDIRCPTCLKYLNLMPKVCKIYVFCILGHIIMVIKLDPVFLLIQSLGTSRAIRNQNCWKQSPDFFIEYLTQNVIFYVKSHVTKHEFWGFSILKSQHLMLPNLTWNETWMMNQFMYRGMVYGLCGTTCAAPRLFTKILDNMCHLLKIWYRNNVQMFGVFNSEKKNQNFK